MVEMFFAENGICIGDRNTHNAVTLDYGEAFKLVHDFLNEFYKHDLVTKNFDVLRFKRLKEGDGSPHPIIASNNERSYDLRCDEIETINKWPDKKE